MEQVRWRCVTVGQGFLVSTARLVSQAFPLVSTEIERSHQQLARLDAGQPANDAIQLLQRLGKLMPD